MLAILPLLLALSSLATSAAIPPASLPQIRDAAASESNGESTHLARAISTSPTNQNTELEHINLAKRAPYYFPETVPDQGETTEHQHAQDDAMMNRLATGNQKQEVVSQAQDQKSISTQDTEIDIPRARLLILPDPDRESSIALGQSLEASYSHWVDQNHAAGIQTQMQVETNEAQEQMSWIISESSPIIISTPPIVPSLAFLFFIAAVLCIVTVVRGVPRRNRDFLVQGAK